MPCTRRYEGKKGRPVRHNAGQVMVIKMTTAGDKILIIDGNSILNRAFYAIRPLSTKTGIPTNAVWGFVSILLKHIESLAPTHGAVAFDLPKPTFRHLEYEGYKATRKPMSDDLRVQMPWAKKAAAALGFKVLEAEGFEADDILGTVSLEAAKKGAEAFVLTGDRDSLQLIGDKVSVLLASNNDTIVFDRAKFNEEYGLAPELFIDVKALMGDTSDNIPGVPGIGEKTALKLITSYGTLDDIYRNFDTLDIAKGVRQKLGDGRDSAYKSKWLATIKRDVPGLPGLDDLRFEPDKEEMHSLFTQLEFTSLIKRLELTQAEKSESASAEELDGSDFAKLPAGVYGVEINGDILLCADSDGKLYSTAVTVEALGFFSDKSHGVIVSDSKKLCNLLASYSLDKPAGEVFDLGLAAYVLDSNDSSYELPKLCASYLGSDGSGSITEHLARSVELKNALCEKMTDEEMRLYEELELPLAGVLAEMEQTGFMIDREGLMSYSEILSKQADTLASDIKEMAGCDFNLNSPKQLGEVLFEKLGLPATKKTKTGYSTSAEALEPLRAHPIVSELLEWRFLAKMKSTYTDGLLSVADENGRVHTTFNQTVTATGRLSSAEPNLQNIPIRQELGRELRRYFVAGDSDRVLIDADYSQIELRLLAAIAGDEIMINAFLNGDDIHSITASQVFGIPLEEVTSEQRKRAKAVNFGIIYGIGEFSLANDIGVSRWQAGEYIKSYLKKYSGVDTYMKRVVEEAKRDGFVTTLLGRRRYIPELNSPKATLRAFGERVAMNSPIQGTAADVIKLAMLGVSKALKEAGLDSRMILQVHDELVLESSKKDAEKAAEILKHEMENALNIGVPLTVDLTIGENWYN